MEKTKTNKIAIDPVCGMKVDPGSTKLTVSYKEQRYYFCAEVCRKVFESNPKRYLKPTPAKRKGWWGRYLDRLAKANDKVLGNKKSCCH